MAKSNLQKEYDKQLRLLQRRIKALQKQGHTFNPKQIEAVTKRKSRPTSKDIEKLKSLKHTTLQTALKSPTTTLPKSTSSRTAFPKPRINSPREYEKTDEEELKERAKYRARVLRLKNQGFDVSHLKKANELSLKELKELKGKALSQKVFKDGKTAYQIRKEEASKKRAETREKNRMARMLVGEPAKPLEKLQNIDKEHKKRGASKHIEQGEYVFHDPWMIDRITEEFQHVENIHGIPPEEYEGHKQSLLNLWYDKLAEIDGDNEATLKYEDYLRMKESAIMEELTKIRDCYPSQADKIPTYFSNLFRIINQGALSEEQARTLSDIQESFLDFGLS